MSCKCNGTLSNTGKPGCDSVHDIELREIHVPLRAGDGTRNSIDPASATIGDDIIALINQADPTKRWFPLPLMKNVTNERGDNLNETFDDQSVEFLANGVRAMTAIIVGQGPHYLKKLQDQHCVEFGVFIVDKQGALVGLIEDDGLIYPIPVDKGSWYTKFMPKTDKVAAKIMIGYNYSTSALDENLEMIPSDDIAGIDLRDVNGLFDVHAAVSSISTTGFTVKLSTDFGPPNDRTTVKGMVAGDFTLAEITPTPGAIVITTVTETPANSGIYVFVIPAQTSGDALRLTPTKTGYDMSEIFDGDHDITIP